MTNKRIGFTLAEVLITLVIIGIIAAITVPMMIQNHKRIETAAKVKKFYSNFSNAIKLAELEQGVSTCYWDWGNTSDYEGQKEFFEKYFGKYISYIKLDKVTEEQVKGLVYGDLSIGMLRVYLNDGSLFFDVDRSADIIAFDVNGDKEPNEYGRDIFVFYILSGDDGDPVNEQTIPHFNTETWLPPTTHKLPRKQLVPACKNYPEESYCSQLLMNDGWEFKDDYPFRI